MHDDDWILQTLWEEINKYYFYQFIFGGKWGFSENVFSSWKEASGWRKG